MGSLRKHEEQFLHEHFRYFLEVEDEVFESINGERLKTKTGVQQTIDYIHAYMKSEFLLTSASILSKRYSYYIATVPIAMMTLFNKSPNMKLENIKLVRTNEEQKWFPKLDLISKEVSEPGELNRNKWLRNELTNLFTQHVRPLFLHINQLTRLSMDVMWENIAIYMFRFYERELVQWYDRETVRKLQEDFYLIVEQLPGEAFGEKTNPFTYFIKQPVLETGARQRKCCCLSYKLYEDSNYCKVCPHLHNQ
ncbi:hypothetical protein GCM10010954_35150 [Halobacillus andaensis]|uniref:Aerobactin siderophore biosynthesis IucA/IucC-like C-terminal domain-containing protein n=1 Tax=Halobacillus andaensis TaxID=1176239 RepID=A0A917BAL3_HALAA|nr:IucA/IucC family C-terminal-domain containing protein [Halobacillus andaensis]MBP2005622.1 ferric iron reductase protein FhuF [Halobacillus andaensis]GGF32946.1 hypothetical protein GCM10010954_35150 [Halobacillus andaensis]